MIPVMDLIDKQFHLFFFLIYSSYINLMSDSEDEEEQEMFDIVCLNNTLEIEKDTGYNY